MHIGGFQPFTLSDFPRRTAAIVFTQGCNFRCPFCHNGGLWPALTGERTEHSEWSEARVFDFLGSRRGRLDGVVVSGGEPTLQGDLADFLRGVRELGFATKLDTNGSRPDVLAALFEARLLDYVAMDIKGPPERYEAMAGLPVDFGSIRRSIEYIAESGVRHHFRTTWVDSILIPSDRTAVLGLVPSGSPHVWQTFRPSLAIDPALRRTA